MLNPARGVLAALFAAVVIGACDNPVGDREAHVRPAIIAVFSGSTQLVRGSYTNITTPLTGRAGQETGPLTVRFYNSAGVEVDADGDYHLNVHTGASGSSAVAQWVQTTAGEFGGRLRGVATGSTTLTFSYVHGAPGGSGHSE